MTRRLAPWLIALVAAAAAHFTVLALVPRMAMDQAMQTLGRDGQRLHQWIHARRATPEARTIVRPSPDLAYSICVYDLSQGDLRLRVTPSAGYWSLSLYDADSDNYRVWNDRDTPQGVDVVLTLSRDLAADDPRIAAPSSRGVAAVRRLAPHTADWTRIQASREQDQCKSIQAMSTTP